MKGKLGRGDVEVFSHAGSDGRNIANGLFYSERKLVVLGRQSGQVQLISKLNNGFSGAENTFLNDVVWAPDGNAYLTDSVRPVISSCH